MTHLLANRKQRGTLFQVLCQKIPRCEGNIKTCILTNLVTLPETFSDGACLAKISKSLDVQCYYDGNSLKGYITYTVTYNTIVHLTIQSSVTAYIDS